MGGYFLPLCWPAVLTRLMSYVFSSIPVEHRHKPFKLAVKNSMCGWCLRPPRVLRSGWFEPEHKLLFTVFFGATPVPVYAMGLWDSHPEGRVAKIIDRSARSQWRFLQGYFCEFKPIKSIISETALQYPINDAHAVLLTR